ncbi:MAG TPA: helix-turn-helix transcriptional regulator [Lachnospiraceae bacterium]|nr:helix-turn-helix transcriptional regulator [Lachnospiraceae bacterium]
MDILQIRMKELREDRELTQRTVADALDISQQVYSNYELGKVDIPTRHLIRLASFYNISVDYLTGISDYTNQLRNLNANYVADISIASFLSDAMTLNGSNRTELIDFLKFLQKK